MAELASLAQLERCHRRHDEVMTSLLEAARRLAAGRPDDGDVERVRDAVAYFERSVKRHFLDEEGSVFPRLSTRRPELAAELASLSADHPAQIEMQAQVAAAARDITEPSADPRPSAGKTLLDAATRLAELHTAHVGREDSLFQIAQDALTAEDDAEIVAEMETRRDRDGGGNGQRRMGGGGGGGGRGGGGGGGGGGGRGGGGGGGGGGGRRRQGDTQQTELLLESVQPPSEYAGPPPVSEDTLARASKPAKGKRATNGVSATAKSSSKSSSKSKSKAAPKAKAAAKKAAAKTAKKPAAKPAKKPAKPAKKSSKRR